MYVFMQMFTFIKAYRKREALSELLVRATLYITTVMLVIPAPCMYYRQVSLEHTMGITVKKRSFNWYESGKLGI